LRGGRLTLRIQRHKNDLDPHKTSRLFSEVYMGPKVYDELRPLFEPESIAVIGASGSPYKWGNWMVSRPINSGYRGRIYPINPKETSIHGLKVFRSLSEIPEPVEMAIITLPAPHVPKAIKACGEKGVRVAIVISAGFAETGPEGQRLQDEVVSTARAAGIRVMGPNVMGMWSSPSRFNTAFRFTPAGHFAHDVVQACIRAKADRVQVARADEVPACPLGCAENPGLRARLRPEETRAPRPQAAGALLAVRSRCYGLTGRQVERGRPLGFASSFVPASAARLRSRLSANSPLVSRIG